jgi:hypothetical protein
LELSQQTVHAVLKKWKLYHTIKDLPKAGRLPKLDDRTKRRLARMMQKGEVTTATELAQTALSYDNIRISPSTARRMLHEKGLKARHMIRKPMLTRAHKKKRLEFAISHRDWTVTQWKQVIFSDETVITAIPVNPRKIKWTKSTVGRNPELIIPTVQGGGSSIMAWGCISKYGFHDFIRLDGTVDAPGYIKVLDNNILPVIQQYFKRRPFIFQQDGAAIHTAHIVRDYFETQNIEILEWPPHSPDLNNI